MSTNTDRIQDKRAWLDATLTAEALREALDNNEFKVQYQLVVNMQVRDADLVNAEALLRWDHPQLGLLTPTDLAHLSEARTLMIHATDFVFQTVAEELSIWRKRGITLPVSVNLEGELLGDLGFPKRLERLVSEYSLLPNDLLLEVAESRAYQLSPIAKEVAMRLAGAGFPILLDNLGRGPVSLDAIAHLPLAGLKIDRRLVKQIETSDRVRKLVRGLVHLGHDLGTTVCAQGVERRDMLYLLKGLGCDQAQGWAIARPMSGAELAGAVATGHVYSAANETADAESNTSVAPSSSFAT